MKLNTLFAVILAATLICSTEASHSAQWRPNYDQALQEIADPAERAIFETATKQLCRIIPATPKQRDWAGKLIVESPHESLLILLHTDRWIDYSGNPASPMNRSLRLMTRAMIWATKIHDDVIQEIGLHPYDGRLNASSQAIIALLQANGVPMEGRKRYTTLKWNQDEPITWIETELKRALTFLPAGSEFRGRIDECLALTAEHRKAAKSGVKTFASDPITTVKASIQRSASSKTSEDRSVPPWGGRRSSHQAWRQSWWVWSLGACLFALLIVIAFKPRLGKR